MSKRSVGLAALVAVVVGGVAGCDASAPAAQAEAAQPGASSTALAPPGSSAPHAAAPQSAPPGSLANQKFGEPIGETTETSLASIASSPADFADKTVKTTGTVTAVCQAAGCWMEIGDATSKAHIKMANHAFYVPRSADGHRAVVQGVVSATEAQNSCGAKDNCGGPEHGANAKLEIVATGVEFLD